MVVLLARLLLLLRMQVLTFALGCLKYFNSILVVNDSALVLLLKALFSRELSGIPHSRGKSP